MMTYKCPNCSSVNIIGRVPGQAYPLQSECPTRCQDCGYESELKYFKVENFDQVPIHISWSETDGVIIDPSKSG